MRVRVPAFVLMAALASCAPQRGFVAPDCLTDEERRAGITMEGLRENFGPDPCELPACEPIEGKHDHGGDTEPPDDAPECRSSLVGMEEEPCGGPGQPPCPGVPPPPRT